MQILSLSLTPEPQTIALLEEVTCLNSRHRCQLLSCPQPVPSDPGKLSHALDYPSCDLCLLEAAFLFLNS